MLGHGQRGERLDVGLFDVHRSQNIASKESPDDHFGCGAGGVLRRVECPRGVAVVAQREKRWSKGELSTIALIEMFRCPRSEAMATVRDDETTNCHMNLKLKVTMSRSRLSND